MNDSWCKLVRAKNGSLVSGGAARNVRIAARGGMDSIVEDVARNAARDALELAEVAVRSTRVKSRLRLVG